MVSTALAMSLPDARRVPEQCPRLARELPALPLDALPRLPGPLRCALAATTDRAAAKRDAVAAPHRRLDAAQVLGGDGGVLAPSPHALAPAVGHPPDRGRQHRSGRDGRRGAGAALRHP